MASIDLLYPGASPASLIAGLAAAGDVIRQSGFSLEHLHAARNIPDGLPTSDWRLRAAGVVRAAEVAAFVACSKEPPPDGAKLIFDLRRFDEGW